MILDFGFRIANFGFDEKMGWLTEQTRAFICLHMFGVKSEIRIPKSEMLLLRISNFGFEKMGI